MIFHRYNGSAKTIAGAGAAIITFTQSDITDRGLLALHVGVTGAGNQLSVITRIRYKEDGVTVLDLTQGQLRALVQGESRANLIMADADQTFTIPLRLLQPHGFDLLPDPRKPGRMMDWRTVCQQRPGSEPSLEISITAAAAGAIMLGWTYTDDRALMSMRMLSQVINCPLSANAFRYNFTPQGRVIGLILPTEGINQIKPTVGGVQLAELPGPQYTLGAYDLVLESQRMFIGPAVAAATAPDGNPIFFNVDVDPVPGGASFLDLYTGAAWNGVANEFATVEVLPVSV